MQRVDFVVGGVDLLPETLVLALEGLGVGLQLLDVLGDVALGLLAQLLQQVLLVDQLVLLSLP